MADLIHVPTLVIQAINLGIIVFVLWKFFFKPYLAFLDVEAQKRIKLEEDISSSAHIVDTARTEAEKIRDDARIDAKTMANEMLEKKLKLFELRLLLRQNLLEKKDLLMWNMSEKFLLTQ